MKISEKTLKTIEKQFALDCNLQEAEEIVPGKVFLSKTKKLPGARIVAKTDLFFRAIIFMGKAYIMADETIFEGCKEIFKDKTSPEWFCEFSNLRFIDCMLSEYGREIADTHIYFLPDEDAKVITPDRPLKWYDETELEVFRENNPYTHAMCFSPTQPDVIAVAAMDEDNIKGIAGASRDGKYVHQIGIDINEQYQGDGLAVFLTTILKQYLLEQGTLPFYGTSESHAISRSVAIKSGFLPAWAEIYVKQKTSD